MKFNFQKNQTTVKLYQIFAHKNNLIPYNTILQLRIYLRFDVIYENYNLKIISHLDYATTETNFTGNTGDSKLLPNYFADKEIILDRKRLNEKFQEIENDSHETRFSVYEISCLPEDFVEKTYLHFQKMIQSIHDETDKYELQFNWDYEKFFGMKL